MLACGLLKAHCAHCPIRQAGMARPQSILARIHGWHSSWWPAWKALQQDRREQAQAIRAGRLVLAARQIPASAEAATPAREALCEGDLAQA